MTTKDVEALCIRLGQLSAEELHSLDDVKAPWLSRLKGKTPERAVSRIQRSLHAVVSLDHRLAYVAWFYCYLMRRDKLRPWLLYHYDVPAATVDCSELLGHLVSSLMVPIADTTAMQASQGGALHACLLTMEPGLAPYDHKLLCLCLWPGLPFVAAHSSGLRIQRRLMIALGRVLRDIPVEVVGGVYGDLDSVFGAARSYCSDPLAHRMAEARYAEGLQLTVSGQCRRPDANKTERQTSSHAQSVIPPPKKSGNSGESRAGR
ncbi:uncharacterized protein LOC125940187 [Dermacentor silvarum]|uniref:uncharacterized protein LOC125940187 n=1 Tax=Dermacentor silvarum TaxID=543639 RepID=UPI002101A90E|nr:uncharacterized protein LOC125940187 [Dermacentor silvarum]